MRTRDTLAAGGGFAALRRTGDLAAARDWMAENGYAWTAIMASSVLADRRATTQLLKSFLTENRDPDAPVLAWAKELRSDQVTKSNLIVGMGEREDEVYDAMRDLRAAGCDVLTIGQYLQPSVSWHLPVDRWVHPEEFARYKTYGETELGFAWASSQNAAVRRHCQTTMGPTGTPVARSQSRTDSRWLLIPTASGCRPPGRCR